MRWILSLTVALVTASMCNLAWAVHAGRSFAWWASPSYEMRGVIRYEDLSAISTSPFVELTPGVLLLERKDGQAFEKALVVADQDSDGVAELALTRSYPSTCGNSIPRGGISIYSGAALVPLGEFDGDSPFELWALSNGDVAEFRNYGWSWWPQVRVRPKLTETPRWVRTVGNFSSVASIPDVNGDGFDEVVVGGNLTEALDGRSVGSVTVLEGADGRVLWNSMGQAHYGAFGNDISPAGDWNRDGVDTVGPGEVLVIPANLPHEAHVIGDVFETDTWSPRREDWINKTDDYLRR